MTSEYGSYTIYQIFDQKRHTEHCNVGVIVFGGDGKQIGCRADTPLRAFRQGLLQEYHLEDFSQERLVARMKTVPDMEELTGCLESTGHAMSMIRFRNPLPTLIRPEVVDDIFERFVLGLR